MRIRIFQLLINCYSAQPSKTPDGVLKRRPSAALTPEESAALTPDRVLGGPSGVLTVSVHCTRVNTTPLPCGYPNKRRYRKSDTSTPGTRYS